MSLFFFFFSFYFIYFSPSLIINLVINKLECMGGFSKDKFCTKWMYSQYFVFIIFFIVLNHVWWVGVPELRQENIAQSQWEVILIWNPTKAWHNFHLLHAWHDHRAFQTFRSPPQRWSSVPAWMAFTDFAAFPSLCSWLCQAINYLLCVRVVFITDHLPCLNYYVRSGSRDIDWAGWAEDLSHLTDSLDWVPEHTHTHIYTELFVYLVSVLGCVWGGSAARTKSWSASWRSSLRLWWFLCQYRSAI